MQYLFQNGAVRQTNYDTATISQFAVLPVDRRPVFLEETDPLVIAFLAAQPSQKSIDIKKIDADVDAIYAEAVGNRGLEYTTAEQQAQAFKDAGYSDKVPPFVASWVDASGLKAKAAADNILAQAAAWRGAVEAIRAQRLLAKKNINNDAPSAMEQWDKFVADIRTQLGI